MEEKIKVPLRGEQFSIFQLLLFLAAFWLFRTEGWFPLSLLLLVANAVSLRGYFTVLPGNATLLFHWGNYWGTVKRAGFYWHLPWLNRQKVSLRKQTSLTPALRLTDQQSQPVIIKCSVEWQIENSAKAAIGLGKWENAVLAATLPLLRSLVHTYPLLASRHNEVSLTSHTAALMEALRKEANKKLLKEGLMVIEIAAWEINFAPEVAIKNHPVSQQAMAQSVQEAREVIALKEKVLPSSSRQENESFLREYILRKLMN